MAAPVKDLITVAQEPKDDGLVPVQTEVAAMFERLASNPDASVEKIERLMALWERGEARKAETAFNAAMSQAQTEMRRVAADAENPQTRSRYASYAALDRALRPIYTKHGFGLSFDTGHDAPPDTVRVLCYATHADGHARTYHVDMPADGKGAKGGDVMTKTHAAGSAVTYGMRYLLKMIFNVAIGEDDDDGNRAGGSVPPQTPTSAPKGYDDWWSDMQSCAGEGWPKLAKAWNESKKEYRDHLTRTNLRGWNDLQAKARAVK
jgi:hypothetical protein